MRDRLVATLSHGQQRQLEIALALAGAPRFILFDEPAAGLSPTERRDLVTILNALPKHIGYIIIEHDLDVALRVTEYVTMLHNGRLFKEGTPEEIEATAKCRRSISEAVMAEGSCGQPSKSRTFRFITAKAMLFKACLCRSITAFLAVVGRNGMGKSTLCNTIAGLKSARSGSIRILGRETSRLEPHVIHRFGVGYVPQGRRVWPSLSVDEHLRLVATGGPDAAWTVDRVYQTFPRLYERRTSGGSQLSGGEQQMLAISRALLGNPRLLIMDEPTEGLAPVIVEQVEAMMVQLAEEGEMAILVVEQNIGVATGVSDHVAIMVNGRINHIMDARALAADRECNRGFWGLGGRARHFPPPEVATSENAEALMAEVYRIERGDGAAAGSAAPASALPSALARALENAGNEFAQQSDAKQSGRRTIVDAFLRFPSRSESTASLSSSAPSIPRARSRSSFATD